MPFCNLVFEEMFHHCWCILFISWKSLVLVDTLEEETVQKNEYQRASSLGTTLETIFLFPYT